MFIALQSLAIVMWLHSKSTYSWGWSSFNMNGRGKRETQPKCVYLSRDIDLSLKQKLCGRWEIYKQKLCFFNLFLRLGSLYVSSLCCDFFFSLFIPLCRFVSVFSRLICLCVCLLVRRVWMCEPVLGMDIKKERLFKNKKRIRLKELSRFMRALSVSSIHCVYIMSCQTIIFVFFPKMQFSLQL